MKTHTLPDLDVTLSHDQLQDILDTLTYAACGYTHAARDLRQNAAKHGYALDQLEHDRLLVEADRYNALYHHIHLCKRTAEHATHAMRAAS